MNKKYATIIILGLLVIVVIIFYLAYRAQNTLYEGDINNNKVCIGEDDFACHEAITLKQTSHEICRSDDCLDKVILRDDDHSLLAEAFRESLYLACSSGECIRELAQKTDDDLVSEAIQTKNTTLCSSLDFYQYKTRCFRVLAFALNDASLCELIKEEDDPYSDEKNCYRDLAIANVDLNYCDDITLGNWGKTCTKEVRYMKDKISSCSENQTELEDHCKSMVVGIVQAAKDMIPSFYIYDLRRSRRFSGVYNVVYSECDRLSYNSIINEHCADIVEEFRKPLRR